MDWNWFFSSLAQSAAAIVGIFGAFIITKILSNQTTFDEKSMRLRQIILDGQKISDDAQDRYFTWYNKQTSDSEYKTAIERLKNNSATTPRELFGELNFSPYMPKERILEKLQELIDGQRLREARKRGEAQRNMNAYGGAAPTDIFSSEMLGLRHRDGLDLLNQLTAEREQIDAVLRAARHHIRTCRDFLAAVKGNPESSTQIAWTLGLVAALFYCGVIYPLSFMPLQPGSAVHVSLNAIWPTFWSLRGILLTVVASIFTGALGMFFQINRSMKYDRAAIAELDKYTELGQYSGYFQVYETNKSSAVQDEDTPRNGQDDPNTDVGDTDGE